MSFCACVFMQIFRLKGLICRVQLEEFGFESLHEQIQLAAKETSVICDCSLFLSFLSLGIYST